VKPIITTVCGDAGGAAAVAPVVEALAAEGRVTTRLLAYRQAGDVWSRRGLRAEAVEEGLSSLEAANLLRRPPTALVLLGTSVNPAMLENRFVVAARSIGVPSLAVLDSWVNYTARFADRSGCAQYVPDRIAIMDERARREMLAEGFAPSTLVVTGQPAFDALVKWRDGFTNARRECLRELWGVAAGELVVLFASQPLSALYGIDPCGPDYMGYEEHGVADLLVSALGRLAARSGRQISLVMRPHPRENSHWMASLSSASIRIVVSSESEARDAALSADIVTGMNSVLLMEACYLGCPVVSLQPGLVHPDILPTNSLGLSYAVYRAEDVDPALERWLDDKVRSAERERLRACAPHSGAAARVVEVIHQMIGRNGNG
jgi:hypothetical protein